jgi:hypothetical protein
MLSLYSHLFRFLFNCVHGSIYAFYDIGIIICAYTTRTLFHFFMQHCTTELGVSSHFIKCRTFLSTSPATSSFELWESPCWSSYRKRRTAAICYTGTCFSFSPLVSLHRFSVLKHIDPFTIKAIPLSTDTFPIKYTRTLPLALRYQPVVFRR